MSFAAFCLHSGKRRLNGDPEAIGTQASHATALERILSDAGAETINHWAISVPFLEDVSYDSKE